MKSLDDILKLSTVAFAHNELDLEALIRLHEEHLMHHKMKIQTLADLQKTREAINYFTQN